MRIKKTPLLFSTLCSFTFFLRAADQQQVSAPVIISSDTAIVNDSLQGNITATDPRKVFKDLFIASTEKTENYSVQLNPRAISFYKKNGFVEFDKHIFKLGNDEQTDIMMKLELNEE